MFRRATAVLPIGLIVLVLGSGPTHAQEFPFRNPALPIDQRVEDLLAEDPEVRAACGPDGGWTLAAEELLAARYGE